MIVYWGMKFISKQEIVDRLSDRGIKFNNPLTALHYYENEGLIPKTVSHGFGRGQGKAGFYPEIVTDMISEIKQLQNLNYRLQQIKQLVDEKFREFYYWEDLRRLSLLKFPHDKFYDAYCSAWEISPSKAETLINDKIKFMTKNNNEKKHKS